MKKTYEEGFKDGMKWALNEITKDCKFKLETFEQLKNLLTIEEAVEEDDE